jgi:hypothetical protein
LGAQNYARYVRQQQCATATPTDINAAGISFEFVETYSQLFCKFCPLKVSKTRKFFAKSPETPTSAKE